MKKSALRCLAISAFAIAGTSAFADENKSTENKDTKVALDSSSTTGGTLFSQEQIDFLKKEMQKKDVTENKITFAGIIQLNANLNDSQRSSAPDFNASKVRLGANISGGIVSGQVEVELKGNQQSTQTVSSTGQGSNTVQTTSNDNGNGQVTIRRAQLNLDVLTIKADQNTFTTTVSLGGVRIGNADATAPDATWTTTGFGRQDGAYLKQAMVFGKTANVELGVGAFNNIIAITNNPYPTTGNTSGGYGGWGNASTATKQANWGSSSFSQSIGVAGHLAATVNFEEDHYLKAKAFLGSQGNSPTDQDSNGTLKTARDVTHTEASLSYNNAAYLGSKGVISGNGVSVWYENETIGRSKTATRNNGDFTYTNASSTDDSQNASLYGLGIAADSSNYLTGMLQKGDFITYALSYAMANVTFGSKSTSQDYNTSQIVASVGYGVNTFETALNFEYDSADTNIFTDSNGGTTVNKKNATKTYLTMAYSF